VATAKDRCAVLREEEADLPLAGHDQGHRQEIVPPLRHLEVTKSGAMGPSHFGHVGVRLDGERGILLAGCAEYLQLHDNSPKLRWPVEAIWMLRQYPGGALRLIQLPSATIALLEKALRELPPSLLNLVLHPPSPLLSRFGSPILATGFTVRFAPGLPTRPEAYSHYRDPRDGLKGARTAHRMTVTIPVQECQRNQGRKCAPPETTRIGEGGEETAGSALSIRGCRNEMRNNTALWGIEPFLSSDRLLKGLLQECSRRDDDQQLFIDPFPLSNGKAVGGHLATKSGATATGGGGPR